MANAIVGAVGRSRASRPTSRRWCCITGGGFLFWTVMLCQALESVTRAYYARSDLDLILSLARLVAPPVRRPHRRHRAVTTMLLACLLASPLDRHAGRSTTARTGSPAYRRARRARRARRPRSPCSSPSALFRLVGPKRTRLIAQIIAAVVGAGFVIGIQAAAILHFGNMSPLRAVRNPADSSPPRPTSTASSGCRPAPRWAICRRCSASC